jgi:putative ABC transport system ATP-binding protein
MSIIKTKELTKIYDMGTKKVNALNGIDLTVEDGEFIAVMGTSGCGKSTLLHMLGGLDRPTSGSVEINGRDLAVMKDKELSVMRRDYIGFVFQKFNLINELNVWENIILPVLLAGKKPEEDRINDLCETLGIKDRLDHTPLELSGGQQQRVAIARALANDPKLILCDEPTGNLDHKSSTEVVELLKTIHDKYKKTIIMVTHDIDVASAADKILKMDDGVIAEA